MLGGGDSINVMPRIDLRHIIPRKDPMASLNFFSIDLCQLIIYQDAHIFSLQLTPANK